MACAKVVKTTRIVGVVALARKLGVTREHLYRVVTGRRESRRLAAKLRRLGLTFEPAPLRGALKRQGKGGK